MSPNFYDYTVASARLTILRALLELPGHRANDSVLATHLDTFGFPFTRDKVRAQLEWLEDIGLIRLARPTATSMVAALRERGGDVATGKARVDGVAQPSPAH